MSAFAIRPAEPRDHTAIAEILRAAFGQDDEAELVARLRREQEFCMELVAAAGGAIVGYVGFVALAFVIKGVPSMAYQLVPLAVAPDLQRQGVGAALTEAGLERLERDPGRLTFVLGHPEYYPRFGFSADLATRYQAPWNGPAFMAHADDPDRAPPSGRLVVPDALLGA